ncbi:B3 domain-containing transcription repressor VAL1-like isoform X2 [Malania oleifera]|uniref:B3 domain-containing transcription repressor VAL1-like isoform X2 n=1 Tax=Malania oleifera TaxID=397392 RepID=UPI0025ADAF85|nr:B3 domain-containing transcription repressor VAL1-like isoform X2 [Malania oleifera]XP_057956546.1 B3 domain-containing transcription repressor VAL1-like isoform X2 [Malania oleifera]
MGSMICMNALCRATTSPEWKRGWALRSGGFANLCCDCGSAYENLVFCDMFHLEESGWRECKLCSKRLHCGCVASKSLVELLDSGGVGCIKCANNYTRDAGLLSSDEFPSELGRSIDGINDLRSTFVENRSDDNGVDKGKLIRFGKFMETSEPNHVAPQQRVDPNASLQLIKREEITHSTREVCTGFPDLTQLSVGSSKFAISDNKMHALPVAQPSLNMSLSAPLGSPKFVTPVPAGVTEGREQSKAPSSFQQGQKPRPILPKPSKAGQTIGSDSNKVLVPQMRVARPPAEGRGRNQLLPRYWPRITDQELQQLSGDLNSTIVPLFEKVLSASDAGRIGRLVLPKACAEAYFPPISQSEGLPLRIQDVKGKEWTFQFRFWPNNNSRMYVLEGVTPCIQSMQLQAGDTVTFSRIDPGGKLVMGFRKASISVDTQDAQTSALPNAVSSGESVLPGDGENLTTGNGLSGLFQSLKGSKDPHLNALSERLTSTDGNINWLKNEKHGGKASKESSQQLMLVPEKKRSRNIGSKNKRLLMHSEDALALRVTWEEAQDLLRPPPCVKPSVVLIEDQEFEEYDEPPVFGKRTIFTTGLSGEQEQWAQCDICSKWRRLPVDALLPTKWTCSENVWDSNRCSCSTPQDTRPKELENLFGVGEDLKKRRTMENHKPALAQECEPSGLDALATAAVLGDSAENLGDPSVGATTKHPRHRSGCTCIVCIQPPSGKGKHKSTCTCNVCMTVKRRFKTLMMRKKIRQSEREAEMAQIKKPQTKDELETNGILTNGTSRHAASDMNQNHSENGMSQGKIQTLEAAEASSAGQIDLNSHPYREDDMQIEAAAGVLSMTSLVQAASLPLEMYLKQHGLTSLMREKQATLGCSNLLTQGGGESEGHMGDEGSLGSLVWEGEGRGESRVDEESCEPDLD